MQDARGTFSTTRNVCSQRSFSRWNAAFGKCFLGQQCQFRHGLHEEPRIEQHIQTMSCPRASKQPRQFGVNSLPADSGQLRCQRRHGIPCVLINGKPELRDESGRPQHAQRIVLESRRRIAHRPNTGLVEIALSVMGINQFATHQIQAQWR